MSDFFLPSYGQIQRYFRSFAKHEGRFGLVSTVKLYYQANDCRPMQDASVRRNESIIDICLPVYPGPHSKLKHSAPSQVRESDANGPISES